MVEEKLGDTWFVDARYDPMTNEIITGWLRDELFSPEETECHNMECTDGVERDLLRVPASYLRRLHNGLKREPLSFDVYKKGNILVNTTNFWN